MVVMMGICTVVMGRFWHHYGHRLTEEGFNLGMGPIRYHVQKLRVIIHTVHADVSHVGRSPLERLNNVVNVQQGFMIFGGKPDRHKDDRGGSQINQVFGRQLGIGLSPFDQGGLMIQPAHRNQGIFVNQFVPYLVIEQLALANPRGKAFGFVGTAMIHQDNSGLGGQMGHG